MVCYGVIFNGFVILVSDVVCYVFCGEVVVVVLFNVFMYV